MRALAITLASLSGCSLVYDFGSFEGSGAQDAAPPPDVNPANLALERVLTEPLVEGTGCLPPAETVIDRVAGEQPVAACGEGSPTVPVVIEGSDIVAGAVVTLTGMGFSGDAVESVVSTDGTLIAFEIAVPIHTGLAANETAALTVTVSQEGAAPQAIDVEVRGLDELVASSFATGPEAVAALAGGERFSRIVIDTPLDLAGAAPFHFQATSLISIEQPLNASGVGGVRRAGGCPGGGIGETGGCGQQGGRAGPSGGGGGGGGNQSAGSSGGAGGTNGGPATESAFLVPLDGHTGRGGGGSGDAALANGRVGGAGGGLIAMTSAGRIEIAVSIDVSGAPGQNGSGLCSLLGGPGGGGGAGGSVLLRARSAIVFSEGGAMNLAAGSGGTNPNGCAGGDGSVGRLRVDTPAFVGELASVITEDVNPVLGAIIAPQSLVRSGPAQQTVALSGDSSGSPVTWLSVNDSVEEFNFEAERTVELVAGVNEICVHVTDPSMGAPEESRHCVVIAYLP